MLWDSSPAGGGGSGRHPGALLQAALPNCMAASHTLRAGLSWAGNIIDGEPQGN